VRQATTWTPSLATQKEAMEDNEKRKECMKLVTDVRTKSTEYGKRCQLPMMITWLILNINIKKSAEVRKFNRDI
jgi:hypothetical protein